MTPYHTMRRLHANSKLGLHLGEVLARVVAARAAIVTWSRRLALLSQGRHIRIDQAKYRNVNKDDQGISRTEEKGYDLSVIFFFLSILRLSLDFWRRIVTSPSYKIIFNSHFQKWIALIGPNERTTSTENIKGETNNIRRPRERQNEERASHDSAQQRSRSKREENNEKKLSIISKGVSAVKN